MTDDKLYFRKKMSDHRFPAVQTLAHTNKVNDLYAALFSIDFKVIVLLED